jgi:hypothetical protein
MKGKAQKQWRSSNRLDQFERGKHCLLRKDQESRKKYRRDGSALVKALQWRKFGIANRRYQSGSMLYLFFLRR